MTDLAQKIDRIERALIAARKDGSDYAIGKLIDDAAGCLFEIRTALPVAQGDAVPVAWLRKNGFRFNGDIEPQDDGEITLYAAPPASRIAELEREVARLREALTYIVDLHERDDNGGFLDANEYSQAVSALAQEKNHD